MKTIQVYDPPLCCATGVCGTVVDPDLVSMATMLTRLAKHGVAVERHNLGQKPVAFADNPVVKSLLQQEGKGALPLVLVDGKVLVRGRYPNQTERAALVREALRGRGAHVRPADYQPDPATATRFMFFTGKGGVGKTSLSCATALRLVEAGKRVLLVSTDPASNLDEVLEIALTGTPTAVPGAPGLFAINIDPVAAAAAYRERLIGPMRGVLPESALSSMEEQLSGSCTVEIAAFDEFSGLIGDASTTRDYDHVIFDTAPTGHTLRLMGLAKAWDQYLGRSTSGTSCLGPLAGLVKQRGIYEATVRILADASATTLVLVSRPQGADLREAERTSGELRALGMDNQCLVINGLFTATCPGDATAHALQ